MNKKLMLALLTVTGLAITHAAYSKSPKMVCQEEAPRALKTFLCHVVIKTNDEEQLKYFSSIEGVWSKEEENIYLLTACLSMEQILVLLDFPLVVSMEVIK